ncbi:MAG: HD domain-containing protein [Treponema sp.]|jgi:putative nucleotidyltransferase with HDIG domain|nr:HD domain-containing protein [Treponema sp.]
MPEQKENMPNRSEAEKILLWAETKNPGKWIKHSFNVAKTAETIAKKCSLNNNSAYVLGLLHDIGRYEGKTNLRHIYTGYNFMREKGYNEIARVCLTHSFPYKNIASFVGVTDCSKKEIEYLENELELVEYDDYDRLIQLCDALGSAEGICLLETRWIDIIRRYGVNKYFKEKIEKTYEIKKYFEKKCNGDIYELFKKEIIENIFAHG